MRPLSTQESSTALLSLWKYASVLSKSGPANCFLTNCQLCGKIPKTKTKTVLETTALFSLFPVWVVRNHEKTSDFWKVHTGTSGAVIARKAFWAFAEDLGSEVGPAEFSHPEGLIAGLRKQFFSFFSLIWSFCSLVFGQKDKQVNEGLHLCVLFRYNLQEHNHVVNAHSIFGVCSLCRSHQNGTSKGVLAISKQSNYLIVLKKSAKCSSWKTKYACNIAVAKSFLERLFENSLWSPKHSVEYRLTGANHLLGIGLGFRTSCNL